MQTLVIDCRASESSGIGVYIREVLTRLSVGMKVIVLGDESSLGRLGGWEVLRFRAPMYSLSEQLCYPFRIPPCDIFWSPHYTVPVLPVRARRRVTTIHDVNHLALSDLLTGTQRLYARFMLKRAVSLSDLVITDSHFSKREIQERLGVDEGRVRIISIGIDRDHFRTVKDAEARDRVRAKYGLPERYLLFVGNVKPHKNVVSLVRAFERLMGDADRKIGLVIVGQREGFITGDRNLSILLEGNDRLNRAVRFTGRVQAEELPVLYSMADLFVFPSLYEGFGMPPLEAMACGCPVAASNAASIPEVCGDAVRYFDPLDSDALAGLIAELLDDEAARSELVRRGFRRVSRFSWEESARAHSALLRKVAAP